ncbi:WD40-repeat-containing domain protein [Kockovaella imperatae]|uniref:Actin-related protein 2/3 complex subunit n=1 Tax=Kockovaella imperatae TaxID=4999 RepID=A0A1Y1UMM2_9TREE|nr:WD40-repeat-containing domain protein [Kockovaella imperatae]ORX39300.1 WD40-repeat-containing domain protein [Kockovaella imperatae]
MSAEQFQLSFSPLTGVAFGPDRTQVAVSPNNNEAQIYKRSGDSWNLETTLAEHDKLITAISWAPQTNQIVTCSQDRNAYVWTLTDGIWKPMLVLLRINRAATCVKWSPKEDKFAVGSGARTIAICSFDEENNWWVSKHIKKPLRSTVLSLDWHPNNVLLAAGAADAKAYVFSAFIKGVDAKPEPTVWGDRLPFGTICGEFSSPSGGWIHDVAFSPSGDVLAYVSHDSTISIVYPSAPGEPPAAHISVRCPSLPYLALSFVSESSLIAAGHDCQPVVYSGSSDGWTLSQSLDDPNNASKLTPSSTGNRVSSGGVGRLNNEAFAHFRSADTKGQSKSSTASNVAGLTPVGADGLLKTVHQNSITWVEPYEWGQGGEVTKVSTAGKDGKLVVWPISGAGKAGGLAGKMSGLSM